MTGELKQLFAEIEKANLSEPQISQLLTFIRWLAHGKRFEELPLVADVAIERPTLASTSAPALGANLIRENQGKITYEITFTEEERAQNPLIQIIGIAEHGHLTDDIDGDVYKP